MGAVLVVAHGFWLEARLTNQQVDVLAQWLPWYCYLGKSVAHGTIPTWLPHQFAGVPFASDPQKGWLYVPVMALFGAFSCSRALGLFITLQPLVAGLGLYWFFRNEGVGRPAATAGGLTLAMTIAGSAILVSLPFAGMLAWIAVTLAGTAGYLHAKTPLRMVGWLALTAFAFSQIAAAHLTDGVALGTLSVASYMLARLIAQVRSKERRPRGAALMFAVPLLAFPLLAAANLLPPLTLLPRTSIGHGYVGMANLATELSGTRTPPAFTPGAGPWWGTSFARGPEGYVGALGILLIPSALASRKWRAPAVGFAVVGFLGWLLNLQELVTFEPIRNYAMKHFLGELWLHSPYRFRYLLPLSLAGLAGYGVQAWAEARTSMTRRDLLMRVLPFLAVAVLFVLWPAIAGVPLGHFTFFAVGAVYSVSLLLLAARGRRWTVILLPLLLAIELTAAGLIQQRGAVPRIIRARLDKEPLSGLGHSFPGYNTPFIEPAAYLTPGSIGRMLIAARDDHGRYLSFDPRVVRSVRGFLTRQGSAEWPAYENARSLLFGLDEVQGYSPVQVDRYWRLLRRLDHRQIYYNAAFFQSIEPQVLKLFGVEWLILPSELSPPPEALPDPVAAEGEWRLYRVARFQPRASVVFSIRTVPAGGGLDEVLDPGFDPSAMAIVEEPDGAVLPAPVGASPTGTATYSEPSPQHARITVTASDRGLLVVRNVFDENWHATVDGRPVPILQVDYLLQGVAVPSGTHIVDLSYRDRAVGLGLAVSGVAWFILGMVVLFLWRRDRRGGATARQAGRERAVPASAAG